MDSQGNRAHLGEVKGRWRHSWVEQWGSLTPQGARGLPKQPQSRKMGRKPLGGSILLEWLREPKEWIPLYPSTLHTAWGSIRLSAKALAFHSRPGKCTGLEGHVRPRRDAEEQSGRPRSGRAYPCSSLLHVTVSMEDLIWKGLGAKTFSAVALLAPCLFNAQPWQWAGSSFSPSQGF